MAWPNNIENNTREIYFSGQFSENRKFQNIFTEHGTLTSTYQGEILIVSEKHEKKFILRAFPLKVREILIHTKNRM